MRYVIHSKQLKVSQWQYFSKIDYFCAKLYSPEMTMAYIWKFLNYFSCKKFFIVNSFHNSVFVWRDNQICSYVICIIMILIVILFPQGNLQKQKVSFTFIMLICFREESMILFLKTNAYLLDFRVISRSIGFQYQYLQ